MTSTAPILGFEASVLFDSRATHSFVSIMFVRLSTLAVRNLEPGLAVTTLVGKTVVCKCTVCERLVSICGRVLPANLVVLPMFSYNIILGMDWLTKYLAVIDCAQKQVTLTPWGEERMTYIGSRARSLPPTILLRKLESLSLEAIRCIWHSLSLQRSKQRRTWKRFLWCASN